MRGDDDDDDDDYISLVNADRLPVYDMIITSAKEITFNLCIQLT